MVLQWFILAICVVSIQGDYVKTREAIEKSTSCSNFFRNCYSLCGGVYSGSCSYYSGAFQTGTQCICKGKEKAIDAFTASIVKKSTDCRSFYANCGQACRGSFSAGCCKGFKPSYTRCKCSGSTGTTGGATGGTTGGTSGGTNPAPINKDEFRRSMLDRHNVLRQKHHSPNLQLNNYLNNLAQKYAEKLASSKIMNHSSNAFGENLFRGYGYVITGASVTDNWYSEVKDYDFNNAGHPKGGLTAETMIGHFTQVVWKKSTLIGVGVATDIDGKVYVVANYYVAGNNKGQYAENVIAA